MDCNDVEVILGGKCLKMLEKNEEKNGIKAY